MSFKHTEVQPKQERVFHALADGDYKAIIVSHKVTSIEPHLKINVTLDVWKDHTRGKVFVNLIDLPQCTWFNKMFCEAYGLGEKWKSGEFKAEDLEGFGLPVANISISTQVYNGREKNFVTKLWAETVDESDYFGPQ